MKVIVPIFLFCWLAVSQSSPQPQTKGACSPANTGNNNTFVIKCQGVSAEQGKQFLSLLNQIHHDQIPIKDVLAALEEIKQKLNSISLPSPVISQHSEGANSPNTVTISQKPKVRRIPDSALPGVREILARYPATAIIYAVMDPRGEPARFGEDWYDLLKSACWQMKYDHVLSFMSTNGIPPRGIEFVIHGVPLAPNELVDIPKESPLGVLYQCFTSLNVNGPFGIDRP